MHNRNITFSIKKKKIVNYCAILVKPGTEYLFTGLLDNRLIISEFLFLSDGPLNMLLLHYKNAANLLF